MEITVEGTHTGFMRKITGKRAQQRADRTWFIPAAEEVKEAVGDRLATTYIGSRQEMVAPWVVLRLVFDVYARDKVYEGGGRMRDTW